MKLHYRVSGHGHPLVILHGLFGSSDNWYTLSNVFAARFRVCAVDQRNHGRSPHSDVFDYKVMADDINNLLVHEGISSAFVLGHSMGGKTAMQFALAFPEKVDRLIVVDIGVKAYPPQHDKIFEALLALKLNLYKTRTELDAALAAYIGDAAVRQLLLKNVSRDDHGEFKWKIDVQAIRRNYDKINGAIQSTRPFEAPTLFVKGSNSSYIEEGDFEGIRGVFPNAILAVIENAGHWVHAEAPQKFSEVVMEFLSGSKR